VSSHVERGDGRGPCGRCGETGRELVVVKDGSLLAFGYACDRCFAETLAEHERLRLQFEELLAAGVDRAEANRIMIERIERNSAPAPN
jgi:hypothetical protein